MANAMQKNPARLPPGLPTRSFRLRFLATVAVQVNRNFQIEIFRGFLWTQVFMDTELIETFAPAPAIVETITKTTKIQKSATPAARISR